MSPEKLAQSLNLTNLLKEKEKYNVIPVDKLDVFLAPRPTFMKIEEIYGNLRIHVISAKDLVIRDLLTHKSDPYWYVRLAGCQAPLCCATRHVL